MYEGELVGELDPKKTTVEELGLYMAGAKRNITVDGNTSEIEESEVVDTSRHFNESNIESETVEGKEA